MIGRGITPVHASLSGSKLVLRAGFEYWVSLRRIRGASYDAASRDWTLPATPETRRALERENIPVQWPEDLTGIEALYPQAQQPAEVLAIAEPVVVHADTPVVIPGLVSAPWNHQWQAFHFAVRCLDIGGGCFLAIIMGGGKTLVSLMVLSATGSRTILIIAPLRVVPVWAREIRKHLDLPMVIASLDDSRGTLVNRVRYATQKQAEAKARKLPLVCVINYECFYRPEFQAWAKRPWDLVIADEIHKIKQPGGKASLAFKHLRPYARRRLGLSGTPMPHSPLDIYGAYRFLDPSIYGTSYAAFRQYYAVFGGYQQKVVIDYQNMEQFRERLGRIMFRVGEEVLDLPPFQHIEYLCEMSSEAARVYMDLERDLIARLEDGTVTAANAMVKLMRLQQITGGSIASDEGDIHRIDRSKADLLQDILEDLPEDEPVVIFCRFHADLDAVLEVGQKLKRRCMELSGRQDELAEWQAGKGTLLAVQISAGGVGVDLTRAAYVAYYSLSLSLGEYDQSLKRVHRPGQRRSVLYIHLIARRSVDQRIRRALRLRAEVVESILSQIQRAEPYEEEVAI